MTEQFSITLDKDRETKNKIRFAERTDGNTEPVIGTLYVPKTTLKEIGNENGSKSLIVTVSTSDE